MMNADWYRHDLLKFALPVLDMPDQVLLRDPQQNIQPANTREQDDK